MMAQICLGISKVLVGGDNITIELWSEVVVNVLGNVMPFLLGSFSTQSKLVLLHSFGKLKRSVIINDISINSEVWNWIVDFISTLLLLVLVLIASSR